MYESEKITNFGKLHHLSKIFKRLYDAPGRPVISKWRNYAYRESLRVTRPSS